MKNKYSLKATAFGVWALMLLLGQTSCDPLGIEPTTMVDENRFWENAQLSRSYVNNFYTWSPVTANQEFTSEQWSDNAIGNDEKDFGGYNQKYFTRRQYDPSTSVNNFTVPFDEQYKKIRSVNLGIERIGNSGVVEESTRNQLLAECYFFRAWLYFELEQYWGSVPYIDKSMTVVEETMIPRCTREELFDYMLKDLDTAADYFTKTSKTPEVGMVTADAVQTFKSRVALYAACAAEASEKGLYESMNAGAESKALFRFAKPSRGYYQVAFDAAKNVLGKYTLQPEYADLFNVQNAQTSPESIWPMMFNLSNRSGFNPTGKNGPDHYYYGGRDGASNPSWDFRSGLFPTQDLVDCYYQKDAADGKWKQWWKTKQAMVDMGGTIDAEGNFKAQTADYKKMYEDRDKRFYATIVYDGSYLGPEREMYLIGTWIDNSDEENSYKYSALHTGFRSTIKLQAPVNRASAQTITSYYPRKYSILDKFNNDGSLNKEQRSCCYFMLRYAEVLLNYAEAAIKLGNEGEALSRINEIRNRAGLDNFDAAVVGHDLWEEYKLQRRLEFALEVPGQRYYDLLRWSESDGKSVIEELNRGPKAMLIFRKGKESEVAGENGYPVQPGEPGYFVPKIETRRFDYTSYDKKFDNARYYFMPYPETKITSYVGLVQNPGWVNFKYE